MGCECRFVGFEGRLVGFEGGFVGFEGAFVGCKFEDWDPKVTMKLVGSSTDFSESVSLTNIDNCVATGVLSDIVYLL